MATVVCNKNCQYRKATFCGKDFVMLNSLGQCSEWFAKNGQPKIIFGFSGQPTSNPFADAGSMDATEQKPPQQEKLEGQNISEKNDGNTEKTEDFLVREG